MFERSFIVGWEHLDANRHMQNTAYLDFCVNIRMGYFQENGFPTSEWQRLQIGPVVMRDEIEYWREFRLLDSVRVTLALAGLSEDASRFKLCNEFFRADGKLAARVTSTGGWLDLTARKLIVPPDALRIPIQRLARTNDFVHLDSSVD
jgi:acyl-CoA thioester hydrolase